MKKTDTAVKYFIGKFKKGVMYRVMRRYLKTGRFLTTTVEEEYRRGAWMKPKGDYVKRGAMLKTRAQARKEKAAYEGRS